MRGQSIRIKMRYDTGGNSAALTIDGSSIDKIDGQTSIILSIQLSSVTLVAAFYGWEVV